MASEDLELRMRLQGARETQAGITGVERETRKLGEQVKKTGREQETSGRKARFFGTGVTGSGNAAKGAITHLKKLAFAVGGAALAYGSVHGIEKSIDRTVELTGSSVALTRVFGLSSKAASEYAIVADTLGIDQKTLTLGMTMMSRNVQAAVGAYGALNDKQAVNRQKIRDLQAQQGKLTNSTKDRAKSVRLQAQVETLAAKNSQMSAGKQAAAFAKVGVSVAMLKRGKADEIFQTAAEGLKKMHGGTEKAALQMTLFGKGSAKLGPLLAQGGKGIEEWRKKSKDAAKALDPKLLAKYREEQRETKLMWTELSVTIGHAVLPKVMRLEHGMLDVMHAFKKGDGAAGAVKKTLVGFVKVAGKVYDFFTKSPRVIKMAVGGLAAFAGAIYTIQKATKAWAAMQLFLDGAMAPMVLIPALIVGIGIALVIAYKKVGWFHRAVKGAFHGIQAAVGAVIGFVKKHWRLMVVGLTGPIGAAVIGIVQHWDTIKSGFGKMVGWIEGKWNKFAGGLNKGLKIAGKIPGVPDGMQLPTFSDAPALRRGGVAQVGGMAIVGDGGNGSGTELVDLPRGARVTPLSRGGAGEGLGSRIASALATGGGTGGGGPSTIIVQVGNDSLAKLVLKQGKWMAARA